MGEPRSPYPEASRWPVAGARYFWPNQEKMASNGRHCRPRDQPYTIMNFALNSIPRLSLQKSVSYRWWRLHKRCRNTALRVIRIKNGISYNFSHYPVLLSSLSLSFEENLDCERVFFILLRYIILLPYPLPPRIVSQIVLHLFTHTSFDIWLRVFRHSGLMFYAF